MTIPFEKITEEEARGRIRQALAGSDTFAASMWATADLMLSQNWRRSRRQRFTDWVLQRQPGSARWQRNLLAVLHGPERSSGGPPSDTSG